MCLFSKSRSIKVLTINIVLAVDPGTAIDLANRYFKHALKKVSEIYINPDRDHLNYADWIYFSNDLFTTYLLTAIPLFLVAKNELE